MRPLSPIHTVRHVPVVADADDGLYAFAVENIRKVLRDELVTELLVVRRLRGTTVAEAVGEDDTITLGLQVRHLTGPEDRGGWKTVYEEQSGFSRRSNRVIVVVDKTTSDLDVLVLEWVHGR